MRDGRTLLEGFAPRHDTRQRRRVGRRIPRDQSLPHQRRPVDRFALLPGRLDPRKLQRLTLRMKGDWSVEFRAYDDGVAYRFVSHARKPFHVVNECVSTASRRFQTTVPYVTAGTDGNFDSQFYHSFENIYTERPSQMNPGRLAFHCLVVDAGQGVKNCLSGGTTSATPGLYLRNADGGEPPTTGMFAAPCPEAGSNRAGTTSCRWSSALARKHLPGRRSAGFP